MPAIELATPSPQFTTRGGNAHVQLAWRPVGTSLWHRTSYTPTQEDWAKRAPAAIVALAAAHPELAGFWSDAEVEADALAYLAATYGFTDVTIIDPTAAPDPAPAQSQS